MKPSQESKIEKVTEANLDEVITLGKAWMKKSKDPNHDSEHARNVEVIALELYDELAAAGQLDTTKIPRKLVSVVVWWHDCYKAILDEFSVDKNFKEGIESEKIIREEISELLEPEHLELVCEAVRHHAGKDVFKYGAGVIRSPLHKILMEADASDILNPKRIRKLTHGKRTLLQRLWVFAELFETFSIPFYLKTKTARKDWPRKYKEAWATWFWRDWVFIKVLFS